MFRFRLHRIPVEVRPSLLAVVLVLGWLRGFDQPETMAVWAAVVFVSLLVHEMGHALVARSMGSEVEIELNGLGGLTRWSQPDRGLTPGARAMVSAAGSAAGFGFAGVAWVVSETWGPFAGLAGLAVRVLVYVNVVWGLLNWLPVRPLDGGHLLRAFLDRVMPRRGELVASVVFALTATAGMVVAFLNRLVLAAAFAAWVLLNELSAGRAPVGVPRLDYEGSSSDGEEGRGDAE